MGQLTVGGRQLVMDSGWPSPVYAGLSSTTPTDAGANVTEPTIGSNGYARQSVAFGSADANGTRANTAAEQFAASGGDWGSMTHLCYYTAATGGTPIGFDDLTATRNMVDGATMDFGIGDMTVDIN